MEIITRKEAKEQGLKHYFTGKPCQANHIALRFTANYTCCECSSAWVKNNPDLIKQASKTYYNKNKETLNNKTVVWGRKNPEKCRINRKRYLSSEKGKAYLRYSWAQKRATKLLRTPRWSDLVKIKEIYSLCPTNHEVDHIYPLRGRLISGLHVPDNLQYLHKDIHKHKNNKFTPVSILRDGTVDRNLL
jgi:hypothetical protein